MPEVKYICAKCQKEFKRHMAFRGDQEIIKPYCTKCWKGYTRYMGRQLQKMKTHKDLSNRFEEATHSHRAEMEKRFARPYVWYECFLR